jgi:hypothetical protein
MIVIPERVDFELRKAAAAQRTGALRGIGDILGELLDRYELAHEPQSVECGIDQPELGRQACQPVTDRS